MKVTTVQSDIIWGDIKTNIDIFSDIIRNIEEDTDLIILPEMFTTGFIMHPDKYVNNGTLEVLQQLAFKKQAAILGSVIVCENDFYYNRAYFVVPDGEFFVYDKRHLFSIADENKYYKSGSEKLIVNYKGWRIAPFICYDLRFPIWCRNTNDYDLAVFMANWPEARINVWDVLLKARAIENLSFVVGVNRIGVDGNNIKYNGHSAIIDYKGNKVSFSGSSSIVDTVDISIDDLKMFRNKFPVNKDADKFSIFI